MIKIRRAGIEDISDLIDLRVHLFNEMGVIPSEKAEHLLRESLGEYFRASLPSEDFFSWVALSDDLVVASSGLIFLQKPPSPRNLTGREAYVMNMYTHKDLRRQGIAIRLLEEIHRFIEQRQIHLTSLHTTAIGRSVYEKMGYGGLDNEMVRLIRTQMDDK